MKSPSTVLSPIKALVKELIHFIFPAYCIHCQKMAVDAHELLCSDCKELIERFPISSCREYKAAALEKEGVAFSFLREINGSLSQEIAATMAAFMVLQMIDLSWPLPDLIIPHQQDVPHELLAQELSKLLGVCHHKKWRSCSDKTVLVISLEAASTSGVEALEEAAPLRIFHMAFCARQE